MSWSWTKPLLLIEIQLMTNLPEWECSYTAWAGGLGSALMKVSGYYGEMAVIGNLAPCWICWFGSMRFFLYVVHVLLAGSAVVTDGESDFGIKGKIKITQIVTVIRWCTHSAVNIFLILGIGAATAEVSSQIDRCVSDITSKRVVGLEIYPISGMTTNVHRWFRAVAVKGEYQSAALISGSVTVIAAYHYVQILSSRVDSHYALGSDASALAGVHLNDAFLYTDELLMVPLLLMKIPLVVKRFEEDYWFEEDYRSKVWATSMDSAFPIILGHHGEVVVADDLAFSWIFRGGPIYFFLYIFYGILAGLVASADGANDPVSKSKVRAAQTTTVIGECTHLVVYLSLAGPHHSHRRGFRSDRRLRVGHQQI